MQVATDMEGDPRSQLEATAVKAVLTTTAKPSRLWLCPESSSCNQDVMYVHVDCSCMRAKVQRIGSPRPHDPRVSASTIVAPAILKQYQIHMYVQLGLGRKLLYYKY